MSRMIGKGLAGVAALAALALGGSALAGAATSSKSGTSTGTSTTAKPRQAAPDPTKAMHPGEKLLTGDTASKVEAAAKAKVPGATIERVENDADGNAAYEAHMRKSDGSEITVYVNKDFKVVKTQTGGPGGPGGHRGPGGPGGLPADRLPVPARTAPVAPGTASRLLRHSA